MEKQEPVTPAGRLFLQEEMNTVINCVIAEMKNSIILQHSRFRSILVKDREGREYLETKNDFNIDKHIFLVKDIEKIYGQGEDCKNDDLSTTMLVNNYLADLSVSTPLDFDKPLSELHLLKEQNRSTALRKHEIKFIFDLYSPFDRSLLTLLGDVISLMSLVLAMCRKVDHPDQLPTIPSSSTKTDNNNNKSTSGSSMRRNIWKLLMAIWCTAVYAMELLLRTLFVKDAETKLSGGSGVELWPRKAATARFKLDDMKSVKNAMANTVRVVSAGLSRYLDYHKPSNSKLQEGLRIAGLGMVNLGKQPGLQDMSELVKSKLVPSWWGNKFGFMLHHKNVENDPLQYVKRAKDMLDKKKLSLEAHFSYTIGNLIICLQYNFYDIKCCWPTRRNYVWRNPITSFRVTSTSLPHALTMHMVSYAGKAELRILVAKARPSIPCQVFRRCIARNEGLISAGLSRYLDYHQPSDSKPKEGLRITGLGMVNLRKQPGLQDMSDLVKSTSVSTWWGNKFGFMLLPIYHRKNVVDNDPLQYVAMWLNNRVVCNTSFTISNVVGPQEEIMFGENPITSFRITSTSLPHALTMHMVSYAGKEELQILVAKDIIPDPQFLAKCFEDAFLQLLFRHTISINHN
ncbi:hypothetical protein MKX01_005955 [Papaver californicum]|nr:hypothetical protein MKX01_005955 [Papaver californicum]